MPSTISELLDKLDITVSALARIYSDLGDPSDIATIQRRIRRRLKSNAEPSGEAIAFLNLLVRIGQAKEALELGQRKDVEHARRRPRSTR